METTIYHLHPIFEFYLTGYFALLAAPLFLKEFLEAKFLTKFPTSKERIITKLDTLYTFQKKLIEDFNLSPLKNHKSGKSIIQFHTEYFEPLMITIVNKREEIKNEADTDVKAYLIVKFRATYDCLFVFMGTFNLALLLLNGCDWFKEQSIIALVSLSIFSILSFILVIFLYYRSWFFLKLSSRIYEEKFHFFYAFFLTSLLLIFCFKVIPSFSFMDYFYTHLVNHLKFFNAITVILCVLAGGLPLLIYAYKLTKHSENAYEFRYKHFVDEYRKELDYSTSKYEELLKRWMKDLFIPKI